jgi:hypothetical protein
MKYFRKWIYSFKESSMSADIRGWCLNEKLDGADEFLVESY